MEVLSWFAERVDLVLLLFDAHKLDISDELRRAIQALARWDEKIRIVLNKADGVDGQQLMRVYGALMWSLGKVLGTPEVARVYIGSFWDEELRHEVNRKLFEDEERDLFRDLHSLTSNSTLRKLNDLIKRARLVKVHSLIIGDIKSKMPIFLGKDKKKAELINNLEETYRRIQKEFLVPAGDFPDISRMKKLLTESDFNEFPKLNESMLAIVDNMMKYDVPNLMKKLPQEQRYQEELVGENSERSST